MFLDVALAQSDAVDMVNGLGQTGYDGTIQLITDASPTIVAAIMRIGARYGLRLRPVLQKPFRADELAAKMAAVLAESAARPGLGLQRPAPSDAAAAPRDGR